MAGGAANTDHTKAEAIQIIRIIRRQKLNAVAIVFLVLLVFYNQERGCLQTIQLFFKGGCFLTWCEGCGCFYLCSGGRRFCF